jgi:hypothetical protein
MLSRRVIGWLAAAWFAAGGTAVAHAAATPVSHVAYAKMLKQANARVTRVTAPLERAFGSKTSTVQQLRQLLLASAGVSTKLGREFAAVRPPERAAEKANAALSRGELDLGAATRALALHLPSTKAAALAYIQRRHPKGGPEVDAALAKLKAAGYDAGS